MARIHNNQYFNTITLHGPFTLSHKLFVFTKLLLERRNHIVFQLIIYVGTDHSSSTAMSRTLKYVFIIEYRDIRVDLKHKQSLAYLQTNWLVKFCEFQL